MDRLAAVRFNSAGKYYYFSTDLDVKKGDKVVVETVRGLEMGEIISDLTDLSEFKLDNELKRIKRVRIEQTLKYIISIKLRHKNHLKSVKKSLRKQTLICI